MSADYLIRIRKAGRILLRGYDAKGGRREIPAINPDEVQDVKQFFPLDKFFIFGHARSGTTLLTRLINCHPKVHCNYQGHFFTRPPTLEALVADVQIGDWLTRRSNRWNQSRDLSPVVLRAACDFIMERDARRVGKGDRDCVVGDKSPNSLLNGKAVYLLAKTYPDARLIFIVRDGRDAVLSHRFQSFIDIEHSLTEEDRRIREAFSRDPQPFLSGQRTIFTEKGLQRGAEGWVRNVTETDSAARQIFGERYHSLRYEDLLANPIATINEGWSFLEVDTTDPDLPGSLAAELQKNPDADWQRQKAGDLISAVEKGKAGSWRRIFTPRDQELFHRIAGDTLADWGYQS